LARKKIRKYLLNEPAYYKQIISNLLSQHYIQIHFNGSPDINDNYLIDIVQQTNSVGFVTGDKILQKWRNSPVQIISWKDFQLTYPI
jgi:predicted nucleic acid-binding protein